MIELPKSYRMHVLVLKRIALKSFGPSKKCPAYRTYYMLCWYCMVVCSPHAYIYTCMHVQTLKELTELLIGRLSVWSADRDSAQTTLLFIDHCVECIETIARDNIPTTLLTKVSRAIQGQHSNYLTDKGK